VIEFLKCKICEGPLVFNMDATVNSYMDPEGYNVEDINKFAQQMVQEYMSFTCNSCGVNVRLTIRDMEKTVRDEAVKMAVTMVSRDMLLVDGVNLSRKVMVYCGGCNGFDGKGSCFVNIYNECDLKRLPNVD